MSGYRRQRGLALLAVLSMLVLGGLAWFLHGLDETPHRQAHDRATERALATAKSALIAWSAARANAPGQLPCPEDPALIGLPNEGMARATCGTPETRVGRLPWRTLGLPRRFSDGNGDALWYAVSPGFQSPPINSEISLPGLTLDGGAEKVVALIFSPGPALPGQDRSAALPAVENHLDRENADGTPDDFVARPPAAPTAFNDRVVPLSHDELFAVVERRVANEVLYRLLEYFCGPDNVTAQNTCRVAGPGYRAFPRPAAFDDSECLGTAAISSGRCLSAASGHAGRVPANPVPDWISISPLNILRGTTAGGNWFQRNGWRELVHLAIAPACLPGAGGCVSGGFLTLVQPAPEPPLPAQRVVVIVAGRALGALSQSRAGKTVVSNYLEGENVTPGDDVFQRAAKTGLFNDTLSTIP